MPVIIPAGFAEVTVLMTAGCSGEACSNVFGVIVSAPPTQADADALSTALSDDYKTVLHTAGFYHGIDVLIGAAPSAPTKISSVAGGGAGLKTGALATPQVQVLLAKTTNIASRQGAGRTFVPDVAEAQVNDNGNLTAAAITAYQGMASGILTALESTAGPWDGMVILHQTSLSPTEVTGYVCRAKVATLRPRYPR